jgi:hypothetical protein
MPAFSAEFRNKFTEFSKSLKSVTAKLKTKKCSCAYSVAQWKKVQYLNSFLLCFRFYFHFLCEEQRQLE